MLEPGKIMRAAHSIAALTVLAVGSTVAQAADSLLPRQMIQTSPEWIVTLKGNLRTGPSYPGSDEFSFIGYPSLSLRRADSVERYGAPDDGLSISILENSAFRIGVVGRFQGGRYLKDNRELFGLKKVDWAVEPGVFVEYWPLEFLRARAEIRRGFGGHEGFVADFGLDAVRSFGAFTVSIGPRLALGDNHFTRTYFGVTSAEAALNGQVTPYRPSGGITSVGAVGAVSYQWSPQWSTTAFVTYKHLVGDAADSPIVKRFGTENQIGGGLTLSYSFGYTP